MSPLDSTRGRPLGDAWRGLYAASDEERIRATAQVRTWTDSGLLTKSQGTAIESTLSTALRRTNRYLRIALFIFGTIVVFAAVGLWIVTLNPRSDWAVAGTAIVAGLIGLALAGFLVVQFRFYRFGVEEAVAVWSVVLLAVGAFLAVGVLVVIPIQSHRPALTGLTTAAIASAGVYCLFGYLYAAFAAVGAAAGAAFFLGLPQFAARLLCASILFIAFFISRWLRQPHGDDYPGDDYAAMESVAWVGIYAVLNLRLPDVVSLSRSSVDVPSGFYWATYAAIWLLPAVGLTVCLRDKHRPMIWSSLLMTITTLLTNKPYLGWAQHTWDPILLGVLLAGSAIAIRRFLARGPDGHRNGFTPHPLVASVDREALAALSTFAVAAQPFAARTPTESPSFEAGRGGHSGGAGAGTDF